MRDWTVSAEEIERERARPFRLPLMWRVQELWENRWLRPTNNHDPGDEDRSER